MENNSWESSNDPATQKFTSHLWDTSLKMAIVRSSETMAPMQYATRHDIHDDYNPGSAPRSKQPTIVTNKQINPVITHTLPLKDSF
jgi:hypothetical protein